MLNFQRVGTHRNGPSTAKRAERLHSMLRRIAEEDWVRLKEMMGRSLTQGSGPDEIQALERLFRKGQSLSGQDGRMVLETVQALSLSQPVLDEVMRADEQIKARIRWTLREISDQQWAEFKSSLQTSLNPALHPEDILVMELVFRTGESVSNVEAAAHARTQETACRRLLAPDVARKNALLRGGRTALENSEPERAYNLALAELENAQQTATRAQNTLAYWYVQPNAACRHARNTLFRVIDAILENSQLVEKLLAWERKLVAVPPVTREQMRWALHRLPMAERHQVLKLIPLNTILMFQDLNGEDVLARATRDRRLAHALFVEGRSEEELVQPYGMALNAVKNAIGSLLQSVAARPLARELVHGFVSWATRVPPMSTSEVRRRLRLLMPAQQAELLNGIPYCAWKRRHIMALHKNLFLDYLSGEWVLGALVKYYNLHKNPGFAGRFNFEGTLTIRGANAALEGMLRKLAEEPVLRHKLQQWSSPGDAAEPKPGERAGESSPEGLEYLMPLLPTRELQDCVA